MKALMEVIKGLTTEQVFKLFGDEAENRTSSYRCSPTRCNTRVWIIQRIHDTYNRLIECPHCGRVSTIPFTLRKNLEEFKL